MLRRSSGGVLVLVGAGLLLATIPGSLARAQDGANKADTATSGDGAGNAAAPATARSAESGEAAAARPTEADVKAAHEKAVRAGERYKKLAEQARDDESKQSILALLAESWGAAQAEFIQAFVNSDWEKWAQEASGDYVVEGLRHAWLAFWHSDPAKSRKACEMLVAVAGGTPAAQDAAINIPYTYLNEESDDQRLEKALEASRALAKHYAPATEVQMRLFQGDLLVALGRKDEAREAYESSVSLAEAIPRGSSDERRESDQVTTEAETRLRLIGKPFPVIRPTSWIGRQKKEGEEEPPREIEFEPGKFTVVVTGGPGCPNCTATLATLDREKRARADQAFDVVALRTPAPTVFVPKDASQPNVGQMVNGVKPEEFRRFMESVFLKLKLSFPIALVDLNTIYQAGAQPHHAFSVSVVDPYGSIEYASTSERGIYLVLYLLEQRLGKVEYPEPEAKADAATAAEKAAEIADPAQLDPEIHLNEHDKKPLPKGPHFAADFLTIEQAYKVKPTDVRLARAYSKALRDFGRHREAAACLDPALEQSPDDLELLVAQTEEMLELADSTSRNAWQPGLAHVQREQAAAWVKRTVAAGPEDVSALCLQVRWMLSSRNVDPGEAKQIADDLVDKHPDDPRAHEALGGFWYAMASLDKEDRGSWAQVERVYGDVLKLAPRNAEAWFRLGLARQWQRDLPKLVIEAYRKAVEIDPENALYRQRLFDRNLIPEWKDRDAILIDLEKLHPDVFELRFQRALEHAIAGDWEKSLKLCDEIVAAKPTDPERRIGRAMVRVFSGPAGVQGAADDLCDAVRLCRGVLDRSVYDMVDVQCIRFPQFSPEQKDRMWGVLFHEFPKEINAPGNAEVWFRDTQKDYVKSFVWCQRALLADPDDPMCHNDIGILHEEARGPFYDQELAAEAYRKAIAAAKRKGIAEPNKSLGYKNAVDNLMKLLWRQGKRDELRTYTEAELKDDPRYADIIGLTEE